MPDIAVPEVPSLTEFQKWSADPAAVAAVAEPDEEDAGAIHTPAAEVETPAAPVAAAPEDDDTDDGVPLSKGLKKRFANLTRQKDEMRGKIETLERQAAERAAPPAPAAAAAETPVVLPGGEVAPVAGDFDSYEGYVRALVKYERKVEQASADAAALKASNDAELQTVAQAHDARLVVAREKYPDWQEKVVDAPPIPISQVMHELIVRGENGPDVAYWLATHTADAARINKLHPLLAAMEMGKIAAKFETGEAGETPTAAAPAAVSRAPRPAVPLNGASTGRDTGREPDPKDFAAWSKWKDRKEAREAAAA